jgi:hypothetical protein
MGKHEGYPKLQHMLKEGSFTRNLLVDIGVVNYIWEDEDIFKDATN